LKRGNGLGQKQKKKKKPRTWQGTEGAARMEKRLVRASVLMVTPEGGGRGVFEKGRERARGLC